MSGCQTASTSCVAVADNVMECRCTYGGNYPNCNGPPCGDFNCQPFEICVPTRNMKSICVPVDVPNPTIFFLLFFSSKLTHIYLQTRPYSTAEPRTVTRTEASALVLKTLTGPLPTTPCLANASTAEFLPTAAVHLVDPLFATLMRCAFQTLTPLSLMSASTPLS